MENSISTSKYLHKKFKKSAPTTIITTVTINRNSDVNLSEKLTSHDSNGLVVVRNEQNVARHETNNKKSDSLVIEQEDINKNSVVTSTNSVNVNNINDQVASISTSSFLDTTVPFTSSSASVVSKFQSSSHLNNDKLLVDRENSIYNIQNRNIETNQSTNIYQDISDKTDHYSESDQNGVPVRWELPFTLNQTSDASVTTSNNTTTHVPLHSIPPKSNTVNTSNNVRPTVVSLDVDKKPISNETSQGGKYVCSYCNLSCSKPSVLQKHIRAHTNERPYPCYSCGFSFKTRSNLYKHCRSRSHANRTKDSPEVNINQQTMPPQQTVIKQLIEQSPTNTVIQQNSMEIKQQEPITADKLINRENIPKSKPYKPKFRHSLYTYEQNTDNNDNNNENKDRDSQTEKKKFDNQTQITAKQLSSDLKQNTDLLKQHINNLIHKNQTILDVHEPNAFKKRLFYQLDSDENRLHPKSFYESNANLSHDEPLNLTARNRKRCMSETEHSQKSLIKELLLKNLTQEQSYVCQFCKISFKNIENFEIHRKKYCKVGENPTSKDIALVRSHSVNVASVLTQKYSRNNESPSKFVRTTLPLKSPGPYLGKTSLISDKPNQVFYENRNPTKIHHAASLSISSDNLRKIYDKNDIVYNPLKLHDNVKPPQIHTTLATTERKSSFDEFQMTYSPTAKKQHTPIKLFGGEVKITETSGETRSFKIDSKNASEFSPNSQQYGVNYGCKVSENMVIKSSLQSGATILQNSSNYDPKVLPLTPKLDEKSPFMPLQFQYDTKLQENTSAPRKIPYEPSDLSKFTPSSESIYDQRNFIDLRSKTAKMFAPTIKPPNLTIPGIPVPNKVFTSPKKIYNDNTEPQISPSWSNLNSPIVDSNKYFPNVRYRLEPRFQPVSPSMSPKMEIKNSRDSPVVEQVPVKLRNDIYSTTPVNNSIIKINHEPENPEINNTPSVTSDLKLYDPLNILINGKLVRYVPGMPGPETGNPIHVGFIESAPIIATQLSPKIIRTFPDPNKYTNSEQISPDDILKIEPQPRIIQYSSTSPLNHRTASPNIVKITPLNEKPTHLSPNIIQHTSENLSPRQSPITPEKKLNDQKTSLKNFRIYSVDNSVKTVKNIENEKPINSKNPENFNDIPTSSNVSNDIATSKNVTSENSDNKSDLNESKSTNKFLRPNSLALKPYIKTHHGLTPTIFNQALISPDTPRIAKKYCQLYLNGNCFSYLGLKSSTKSTYCTLNKTQPFYVQSFGTLSMYSEWRHLECKLDYVRLDTYDSRQRRSSYTIAKHKISDRVVDSSYKSVAVENSQKKEESTNRSNLLPGGYESNEEYTYIRGRGRGKYVCDQCGIRCKKPSMLKKHIRTHSDVRPYTCQHCNFSFKTKGNLTKHMKSKSHYKRTNSISASDTNGEIQTSQCSSTPSDDDTDSDGENENDSDDSTRLQDHEAAHCLLSLSQNRSPASTESESVEINTPASTSANDDMLNEISNADSKRNESDEDKFNKTTSTSSNNVSTNVFETMSSRKPLTYPYYKVQVKQPATSIEPKSEILKTDISLNFNSVVLGAKNVELFNQNLDILKNSREIFSPNVTTPTKIQFIGDKLPNADLTIANYQQKFVKYEQERALLNQNKNQSPDTVPTFITSNDRKRPNVDKTLDVEYLKRKVIPQDIVPEPQPQQQIRKRHISVDLSSTNNSPVNNFNNIRKRKVSYPEVRDPPEIRTEFNTYENNITIVNNNNKPYNNIQSRSVDLIVNRDFVENRNASARNEYQTALDLSKVSAQKDITNIINVVPPQKYIIIDKPAPETKITTTKSNLELTNQDLKMFIKRKVLVEKIKTYQTENTDELLNVANESNDSIVKLPHANGEIVVTNEITVPTNVEKTPPTAVPPPPPPSSDQNDTSAMQTLAEIAMKRVSTENTKLAQSVATEYLKLATKNETPPGVIIEPAPATCNGTAETSITDLIIKSEENKSCTMCAKNFSKPSQLRLHMNTHYIQPFRPFRCESCSVSFRSKGHLQKHERSANHHNKLSSSPTTSSSEPRPFKCSDCNIAFRIHGHLAKHLRSKTHIMRLECLARVPFGLYAELERANSLLTEINTTDCDMCLESLKILARKLFSNDPNKLAQIENPSTTSLPPSNNQPEQQQHQIAVGSP